MLGSLMKRLGQKKSFQMYWPVTIITADIAGHDNGTITWRIMLMWPAPSIFAASSSSRNGPEVLT